MAFSTAMEARMPDGSDPKALETEINSALTAKNWQIDQRLDAYAQAGTLNEDQVERLIGFADSQPEVFLLMLDLLDQRRDGKLGMLELIAPAEFESMIAVATAAPAQPCAKQARSTATCSE